MPIQEENIVFVESQVLDDVPEGGGAATGRVVADGELNNVFEDISDLDRAYGRFNLRKLFLAVRSLDTDLYGGAKLVISSLPNDASLDYALFTTRDPFDTRASAANRVAAYYYKGPMWHGALWENHIVGMRQIRIIQRIGTRLPPVGKTLCLVQFESQPTQIEQYVRVTRVESEEVTFSDAGSDFQRLIVTLDLSDALRYSFTGHAPNKSDAYNYTTGVRIRDTTVVDAQIYSSGKRLSEPAAVGDLSVRAESIFTALVPSAQTETPLVNQAMAPDMTATVDAGGGHSVEVAQVAHTRSRGVTAENRRLNWIETLTPRPHPGAISVAFMAQGNWYELRDDGAGKLAGSDTGIGAGTVDYITGVASITLGALPDAGSAILWTWASPAHYTILAGGARDTDPRGARLAFQLPDTPVVAGSLEVTFRRANADATATSNTAGEISGSGVTGKIDQATGLGELFFTVLPDPATAVNFAWNYRAPVDPEAAVQLKLEQALNGARTINFGQPIEPLTVSIRLPFVPALTNTGQEIESGSMPQTTTLTVVDDGEGSLILGNQLVGTPPVDVGDAVVGSVDYATGLCTLEGQFEAYMKVWSTGAEV